MYFLPELQKTALVAINQLPVTEDTLWLRVLGRGAIQEQAVNELLALPEGHPLRGNILELLGNWRVNVAVSENLSEEDRELLMNLSPAYLKWREETLQKGRQEGRLEGQRQMVENVLKARFGSLDDELSEAICASQQRFAIAPMLQLPPEELTRLLLTLSREELLARFGYGAWREALLQEGRVEERRQIVENVLRVRFGLLDERLSGAIAPLLQLPTEELTRLLLTVSPEELLERFGGESS